MLGFSRTSWARFGREGAWVLAGQVGTAAAGLVGVRVLTELAPPAVFGEASLWLGALVLARSFFFVPVSMFQVRFYPDYLRRGQAGTFTRLVRRLAARSTTVFILGGALVYLAWIWATGTPPRPALLIALACAAGLDTAKSVRQNVLNADRRQKALAIWTAAEAWTVVVCTAVALRVLPTTEAYLFGTAAGYLLPLALFALALSSPGDEQPAATPNADDRTFSRQVLAYGLPFIPLALLGWFTNLGDRYLLDGLRDTTAVGLYVAAFGIASKPAMMVGGVISTAARPVLFNAVSGGRTRAANRIFHLWLAGTATLNALLVVLLAAFGPWIARWFLAAEYREGAPGIITWVAAGYGVYATSMVVENRIMAWGRSAALIPPIAVGAALKFALTYWLVRSDGPLGAARATCSAFCGQFLATWWAMTRLAAAEARGTTRDLSTTENGNGPSERSGSPPPAPDDVRHTGDRPDGE
jgi:O-antigen/teichoic acid export membrane protein